MYEHGRRLIPLCLFAFFAFDALSADDAPDPLEIWAEEPLAESFSLKNAASYLDRAALRWQEKHKCGTCHTNFAHLVARPSAANVLAPPPDVRAFIEDMVKVRWKEKGPRWDAEVVVAATTLAMNDGATGSTLNPVTRTALERMYDLQRKDGGWDWLKCGWPPMESDDHYGATFAALGIGQAPEGHAETPRAKKCLEGIRKYLAANPPASMHHRLMVLWASCHVDRIMNADERGQVLDSVFKLQRPDGGWAVAGLMAGWDEHKRKDDAPQSVEASDGYGTGFVIYVAREAGVAADDPRLEKGIQWLKKHQRSSGRWFTPSPTKDSRHFISNVGTAFAVMALSKCGDGLSRTASLKK